MLIRLGLALSAVLSSAAVSAQPIVTSTAPESVAVTIYRAPERDADEAMQLEWLGGYALITETRTVDLPAGKAVIRFEGVAGGMLPESALITGLPEGVSEKNLDADLLTPGSLYAHSLGRPATLRRTHPQTGDVHEEPVVIRSGLDGSVIVQTRDGYEAANCGPLSEALSWSTVPEGLSARPTLSVETQSDAPARITLSLSYLAWGFDWQANYVVQMQDNGRKADILAWVTLASGDPTSFPDAATAVVGGTVNRVDEQSYVGPVRREDLVFHCFYRPVQGGSSYPPAAPAIAESMEIVVTAQRRTESLADVPVAVTVTQEELGDLKLYRVPMPTTVASNSQKQVALFQRSNVKFRTLYSAQISATRSSVVTQRLRMQNDKRDGLGLSLPSGGVTVFEPHSGQSVLSGEGVMRDAAVGQKVEVTLGEATQVIVRVEKIQASKQRDHPRWAIYAASVSNANPWPVAFEGSLSPHLDNEEAVEPLSRRKLDVVDGRSMWKVEVPANGVRSLRYRVTDN